MRRSSAIRVATSAVAALLLQLLVGATPAWAVAEGQFCAQEDLGATAISDRTGDTIVCQIDSGGIRRWLDVAPMTPSPQPASPTPAAESLVPADALCHSSYVDACVPPRAGDVDCPDGTGDGPTYAPTTDFRAVGPDVFGLDRDRDGIACESGDSGSTVGAAALPGAEQPFVRQAASRGAQTPLARTGQTSGRQGQLALALVLFGTALLIAPRVVFVPKRRMD